MLRHFLMAAFLTSASLSCAAGETKGDEVAAPAASAPAKQAAPAAPRTHRQARAQRRECNRRADVAKVAGEARKKFIVKCERES